MSRFIVVDLGISTEEGSDTRRGGYAVADTATEPTDESDLGEIVWRDGAHEHDNADAKWDAARRAEAQALVMNNAAPLSRPRTAPPSLELDENGQLPASTAEAAPAGEPQSATLASVDSQTIAPSDVASLDLGTEG